MDKNYNINFYNKEKAKIRNRYFKNKIIFFEKGLDVNKIFFDYILNEVKKNSEKKLSILDLGTGTGYVPKILCQISKANFKIIGIDLSQAMLEMARQKYRDQRITYKFANSYRLPFKNNSFDLITNKLSTQFSFKEVYRVF